MSRWFAVALAAGLAGGCQTYQSQPLDSAAMLRSWEARSHGLAASGGPSVEPSTQPDAIRPRPLGLPEAEAVALLLNPGLRRARLEANVERASAAEAGRWADPTIAVDLERIVSGGSSPWVIGGLVNLTLPLSGRLDAEKQLANAEANRTQFELLWQERQTVAELRRAWIDWQAATDRVKTLADVMNDLTAIESSVQCLLDAGEIEPTDARLFTIDLARRRVQSIDAQRDAKRSELRVRQLIGITPDAAVMLVPAGEEALGPRPVADPESHPRLLVARADYAAAERVLDLAVRRQFPDIEVGGGLGSEEGDTRLLGGVSVPIPILNGNRREIAEARARRDAVRAAYEAALLSLIADRTAAAAEIEATQASLDAMQATVVPLVDHQIKAARHLLDAGEFNPLVVRDAIAAAADVRMEMNAAKRAVALAKIEQCLLTETASQTPQVKP